MDANRVFVAGLSAGGATLRCEAGGLSAELEACLTDYVRYVLERDVRSARFVETLRTLPGRIESRSAISDV